MSEEKETPTTEIPESIEKAIDEEVGREIAILLDTAAFYQEFLGDYKRRLYSFLNWVKGKYHPSSVLYPASGSDKMAKLVFGEEKVVHTSIEDYGEDKGEVFFDELGEGKKVVADNLRLPFSDSQFQAITLIEVDYELIENQRSEFVRVLEEGGVIAIARSIEADYGGKKAHLWENFAEGLPLKEIAVPVQLQVQGGELDNEFILYQKVSGRIKK